MHPRVMLVREDEFYIKLLGSVTYAYKTGDFWKHKMC